MFKFNDYKTAEGKPALSTQIHITDMPTSRPEFPSHVRQQADAAAPVLIDAFVDLAQSLQVERDLLSGARLDPRKRRAVGKALRTGEVDSNVLRPYQRRSLSVTMPRLAIVGSCGVAEVNSDDTYLSRITTLVLGVAWACEIAGLEVYACLMEGHGKMFLSDNQPYRAAQLAYMLVEPGRVTPLQAHAVSLSRDQFYEVGYARAYERDDVAQDKMSRLIGRRNAFWGYTYPGRDGGEGVHWSREFLDADVVIGIGRLTDRADADIQLGNRFEVRDAAEEIARQARALSRPH